MITLLDFNLKIISDILIPVGYPASLVVLDIIPTLPPKGINWEPNKWIHYTNITYKFY